MEQYEKNFEDFSDYSIDDHVDTTYFRLLKRLGRAPSDSDCCGSMTLVGGVCALRRSGESCEQTSDCQGTICRTSSGVLCGTATGCTCQ